MRKIYLLLSLLVVLSWACAFSVEAPQVVSGSGISTPSEKNATGLESSTPTVAQVTAFEAVNIRKNATADSDDVGDLYSGAIVYVLECRNGWARISAGWVNGYYLGGVCR